MDTLNVPKVILITGPAGSGKTALADMIAKHQGWIHVSEDDYWVELKKGHPGGESRSPLEEQTIQPKVLNQILHHIEQGRHVVFEFILFHNPPTPLIYYQSELKKRNINLVVKVLKPTADVILERQKKRGRGFDTDTDAARKNALHQLDCLNSSYIKADWIIDNSQLTLEEVYQKYFLEIVD